MANYDGHDDSILPTRLQKILALLPDAVAQRLRDWLTGFDTATIEDQIDYILGDTLQPPINPTQPAEVEKTFSDPWEVATENVENIAALFKVLSEAGMTEETAVAIIADEVQIIRQAGKVVSGLAQVPVAGARAIIGQTEDGDISVGGPVVGWPPRPL